MYAPEPFAVTDPAELDAMLAAARLGAMVTHGPDGLFARHLPFLHDAGAGRLIGHLARANPHARHAPDGSEALVIFVQAEAYVSPGWYPSKAEHGRVVPTWNYEAVHVRGRLTWFSDPDRLTDVVTRLTDANEADKAHPWAVTDAPADHVERLIGAIVGVQIEIGQILGKRKLSQNRSSADQTGVVAGLAASPDPRDRAVAEQMGRLMAMEGPR